MYEYSFILREEVKKSYLYSGKTQKQLADDFGISDRTIRNWVKQFRWNALRHRIHHPPSSLAEGISIQLSNLQADILTGDRGIPTAEQALIMQKLLLCLIKLNGDPNLDKLINAPDEELDEDVSEQPEEENMIPPFSEPEPHETSVHGSSS